MTFQTGTPASVGIHPKQLLSFLDKAEAAKLHLHSFQLLRHSTLVAVAEFAPYGIHKNHMMYSLSKSFTSLAAGFAVQEGLLKTDDLVLRHFPHITPSDERMKQMTLRDLLTMQGGHEPDPTVQVVQSSGEWAEAFFGVDLAFEPGVHFNYNTAGTYIISALVQKVAGVTVFEYLRPRLFEPLGFGRDIHWETSPTGVSAGGYGLNLPAKDLVKLGYFLLNKGCWEGKQLLDAAWITDSTKPWADNANEQSALLPDWASGYGYQFWCCVPDNVYRGDGAMGQYCVVMPDQDAVMVITSGLPEMQSILTMFWQEVLAHFGPPLAEDGEVKAAQKKLEDRLSSLALKAGFEQGGQALAAPAAPGGAIGKRYVFDENTFGLTALRFEEDTLVLALPEGETRLPLAADWTPCPLAVPTSPTPQKLSLFGSTCFYPNAHTKAALCDGQLLIEVAYVDTPFQDTWSFTFQEDEIVFHIRPSVPVLDNDADLQGRLG